MSNLVEFAKAELERIGKDNDGMQDMMNKDILEIVKTFSKQGHSGFTASYALNILKKLLDFKPLQPLTGEDSEWTEVHENDNGEPVEQNKRYYAVFRENRDNSRAYNINGKVFSDDGGETWFTSRKSRVPVTFPYTVPDKPEYVILKDENMSEYMEIQKIKRIVSDNEFWALSSGEYLNMIETLLEKIEELEKQVKRYEEAFKEERVE